MVKWHREKPSWVNTYPTWDGKDYGGWDGDFVSVHPDKELMDLFGVMPKAGECLEVTATVEAVSVESH